MNKQSKKSYESLNMRDITDANIFSYNPNNPNNHSKNMERIMMERNSFFNQDSREYDDKNASKSKKNGNMMGEITGELGNSYDTFEQGMPIRSQYITKKPIHDGNSHLDFDIYHSDNKPSSKSVESFDPSDGASVSSFADITTSMNKLSTHIKPVGICSQGIENIGCFLNMILIELMAKNNYIINNVGLYTIFAALYLGATNATEHDIKNYFGFPKKDILHKGLSDILYELNSIDLKYKNPVINFRNIILVGNDVPINMKYTELIQEYADIIRININNPVGEAEKINRNLAQLMQTDMRKYVIADNLYNLQLMFMNIAVVKPLLLFQPDEIKTDIFQGLIFDRKLNFINYVGKSFKYYEDNLYQLIELNGSDNYNVGILMPKESNLIYTSIEDSKLKFYLSHAKATVLDLVKIPMFRHDFKMRYTNILKETNLESIFINISVPDFIPEGGIAHDIVQNITFIFDGTSLGKKSNQKTGYQSSRKFMANKPFMYYIRLLSTDTFILLGRYC